MVTFPTFFLGNIGQESVFYDILERKNAFLGYIKKQIQKLEKLRLFQRVWSKNGRFSIFFFANIGQQNVLYDNLKRKNSKN